MHDKNRNKHQFPEGVSDVTYFYVSG